MMSRLLTPREQLVIAFIGVAVVVGSVTAVWLNQEDPPPEIPATPDPNVVAEPATLAPEIEPALLQPAAPPEPHEIVVSVRGAVHLPGVYTMKSNQRVNDLLNRAGGTTETAQTDDINLAAKLIDGSTLTVPENDSPVVQDGVVTLRRSSNNVASNPPQYTLSGWAQTDRASDVSLETTPSALPAAVQPAVDDSRIDLNHATTEQLEELPGIGPVLAQSIVEYRSNAPFASVDQLQNVRGIGPKRFESLRDLVMVSP